MINIFSWTGHFLAGLWIACVIMGIPKDQQACVVFMAFVCLGVAAMLDIQKKLEDGGES